MGTAIRQIGRPGIKETGLHGGHTMHSRLKTKQPGTKSANCIAERALVCLDDGG